MDKSLARRRVEVAQAMTKRHRAAQSLNQFNQEFLEEMAQQNVYDEQRLEQEIRHGRRIRVLRAF